MSWIVGLVLGFGVVWAYIPNVTGSAILTGWAFLVGFLPFLLWWRVVPTVSPLHWLGLGFVLWAGLGLFWTENIYDGIGSFAIWVILSLAFTVGSTTVDPRPVYLGVCVGMAGCVLVAVAQALGWHGIWTQEAFTSNVPSIFVNATVFGTACALVLVLAIFSGSWWSVPISALGLYLSGARGPAVAAGIAIVIGTWRNWSRVGAVLLLVPCLLFTAGVFLNKSGNIEDLGGSARIRAAYWFDTAEALTIRGSGPGSFFSTFPSVAKRTDTLTVRPEHPYSDILEVLYEFGLPSVLLFWLLWLALAVPLEPERSVLLTFLLSGLAYPNLVIPLAAFLAAFSAGRLALGWSLVRSGVNPRRPELPHWMGYEGYGPASTGLRPVSIQSKYPDRAGISSDAATAISGDHSPHVTDSVPGLVSAGYRASISPPPTHH